MTDQEITRALAEKCMGWTYEWDFKRGWWNTPDGSRSDEDWHPLTSDTDCMGCVDKMAERGWCIFLSVEARKPNDPHTLWECDVHRFAENGAEHYDPDRKRTICIAILKALGEWKEP